MWAGRESGELACGCGHRPRWTSREQAGQLQWHMFACSLPEETKRPFALYCHNTAGALPARVSLRTILNRTTQSRTDAASSEMDDATRAIEIERTITKQM